MTVHHEARQRRVQNSLLILKEARRLIKAREETFVCVAISTARRNLKLNDYETSDRLRVLVGKAIHPCYTMDEWVARREGIAIEKFDPRKMQMRERRVAWLGKWISDIKETYNV